MLAEKYTGRFPSEALHVQETFAMAKAQASHFAAAAIFEIKSTNNRLHGSS